MAAIHLLRLENVPIFRQLQIEEALLRANSENWCILNHGSDEAIVMGISGKMEKLINPEAYAKQPVPIIRRFSGGGTVFVDHNTCFVTLICNHDCSSTSPYPDQLMGWNAQFYDFLGDHGFSLRENDYVLNDRKCGGNAQYLAKKRWLQHTSLLWDYQPEKMNLLKLPPKMPGYRESREHDQFLCSLKSFGLSKECVFNGYVSSLKQKFDTIIEVPLTYVENILTQSHRKTTKFELYA